MLLELLKNKKCFKLICGAGNEDILEVEKLVTLYSQAGCNFFDLCAKPDIIDAAKRGLNRAGIKKDRYLCCSVGVKGDPHVSKAIIDSKTCVHCGKCYSTCLQKSINIINENYEINDTKCIGCRKCIQSCPTQSIHETSKYVDLKEVLPQLIEKKIDCIEFHTSGTDDEEVYKKWKDINNLFDGPLSICIDRSKLGNEGVIKRISRMLENREPYSTIIQADGAPMSGGKDDYKSTLQTVAMAEIIQNANLPVYLLLSGGTNTKSSQLASLCDININGVAVGSYARKIVKEYIYREDFLSNRTLFKKALTIAKNLVDVSLSNIK